jgi:Glutathione S-transferase, N-terminal domain
MPSVPSYTLYAPEGSFRAFAALIAAEYNGITVQVETCLKDVPTLSPTGKAPILVINNKQVIFSSHAIARYLGGMRRDTLLLGSSLQDNAAVDSWMDFCAQELELPACVWYYPVRTYLLLLAPTVSVCFVWIYIVLTQYTKTGCWIHAVPCGSVSFKHVCCVLPLLLCF